jgi:hypothetical protein
MYLAIVRTGIVLLAALLLQSCGGGDDDGDGGGNGGSGPRLTLSDDEVGVTAAPGDFAPGQTITLTISNPPAEGLHIQGSYSSLGIESVDFIQISETEGELYFYFKLPGVLQDDTYEDTAEIRVCRDENCDDQIRGSPATIRTSYTVNGEIVATLSRTSIERTVDSRDEEWRTEKVQMSLDRTPEAGIYLQFNHSTNAINYASYLGLIGNIAEIEVSYYPGSQLSTGAIDDTISVTACYESSCARELAGSPFTISSRVEVSAGTEPGLEPLEVLSRATLSHNVVDAEFSKALDAVIMVGSYPSNALYVYDVATGTEQQQSLVKAPTAVSVAPDGLSAAVGHDALISIVDLAQVGQAGAPAPTTLNVSADVLDVILDGHRKVHALPRVDQWQEIHTVDIATNAESLANGSLYAGALGRLHPSGDYLYTADNGLSPSDIEKWDLTTSPVQVLYDSPYHGDYEMCGNLWFHENGATIYTACGNTFRSSTVQADDMVYSGRLELWDSDSYGWLIRSLSQSSTANEIVLLESQYYYCYIGSVSGPCYTHFAVYESSFLNREAVYTLGPIEVNDFDYAQVGLFVFHNAAADRKVLISKLQGMPNPDAEYYLSVID